MRGKIFGLPLVLILLVIFIAVLVDVPMISLYRIEAGRLATVAKMCAVKGPEVVVTPTSVPSPSVAVSPSPTPKGLLPIRSGSPSGAVK